MNYLKAELRGNRGLILIFLSLTSWATAGRPYDLPEADYPEAELREILSNSQKLRKHEGFTKDQVL